MSGNNLKFNFKKHLFRVLVFPSCNEPGLEVIASLIKSNKVDVFGGSSGEVRYDPSRQILKNYRKYPSLFEKDFRRKFTSLIKKNKITHVFPTVDVLVSEFAGWKVPGVTFITPSKNTADLVISKKATYETLKSVIPVPEVVNKTDMTDKTSMNKMNMKYPLFAKPDQGSGAKSGFKVNNDADLQRATDEQLLITEYLPGEEYTVDAVSDLKGKLLVYNIRVRGKIGRSIALGTQSVKDPLIGKLMDKIADKMKITGPWFAQFKRDKTGRPVLMEINCRMGGSSTLTRLSGVNIPLLSLFIYSGFEVKVPKLKPGLLINRALTNLGDPMPVKFAIWDLDDTLIRKDGKPDPESIAALFDLKNRGVKQILLSRKPEIDKILKFHQIPDLFLEIISDTDKGRAIKLIIKKFKIKLSDLVIINDSTVENFILSDLYPDVRITSPDSLNILGKEKIN
jgi:hypothetical protein